MKDYKARHGPKGRKPGRIRLTARQRTRPPAPQGLPTLARSARARPSAPAREQRRRLPLRALLVAARRLPLHGTLLAATLGWLSAGLVVGGLALWRAPLVEVRLSGREALAAETVLHLGGLAAGLPMHQVDPFAVAARIAAHPSVVAADARRLYPGRLEIRLAERRAELRVALADGRTVVLDAQDVVLAVLPLGGTLPESLRALPVVAGIAAPAELTQALRDPALARGRAALAALTTLGLHPGASVSVNSESPFLLTLRPPDGPSLVLPSERLEPALRVYHALTTRYPHALDGMRVVDFSALDAQGGGRIHLRRR